MAMVSIKWTASSKFGTYRLCEQRRFRRACASAQSRQNLLCSLIQAVNQEELSDRKPDPWPLWMTGHAQLKFVMTECLKTQIRLTGPKSFAKEIRKILIYKITPAQRKLIVSEYTTHKTNFQILLNVTWGRVNTTYNLLLRYLAFVSRCYSLLPIMLKMFDVIIYYAS